MIRNSITLIVVSLLLGAQQGSALDDQILEKGDKLLEEAKASYEDARSKSSVAAFVEAGFKLEEARIKFIVLQEIGSSEKQKIATDRLRAINQLSKLIHDGKVAISGTSVEAPTPPAPAASPAAPATAKPAAVPNVDVTKRVPVPEATHLKEAEKLVKDVFKDQYLKKGPAERQTLARAMLDQISRSQGDIATQWILCREAQDIAAQAGDARTALEAADIAATLFDVDGMVLRSAVIATASKAARTPEELTALAQAYLRLSDEQVAADLYEAADKSVAAALQLARRSNDVLLTQRAMTRSKEVGEARTRFAGMKKILETVAKNPDDAAANQELGQFLCFVKGNWDLGTRFLVKGPDGPLKMLAQKELAIPTAGADIVALADGWWELAEKEKSPLQKAQMLARAKTLYELALNEVQGLVRIKIENRLYSDPGSEGTTVNLLSMIDLAQDIQGGGNWTRDGAALVSPAVNASGNAVIRVPYIPAAEYDLRIVASSSGGLGSLDIGLTSPSGQFSIVVDGFGGQSGLHVLDGKGADRNATNYPRKIFTDSNPRTLLVSVRKSGVTFTADGKTIFSWKGEFSRLTCDYGAYGHLKERRTLFLTSLQQYRITRLELTTVSGQGKRIR